MSHSWFCFTNWKLFQWDFKIQPSVPWNARREEVYPQIPQKEVCTERWLFFSLALLPLHLTAGNGAYENAYLENQFSQRQGTVMDLGPETGCRKIHAPQNVLPGRHMHLWLQHHPSPSIRKYSGIWTSHGKKRKKQNEIKTFPLLFHGWNDMEEISHQIRHLYTIILIYIYIPIFLVLIL